MKVKVLSQLLESDLEEDKKAEGLYHNDICEKLRYDLTENTPGFHKDLTNDLMVRYKTDDWRSAYKEAYLFHIKLIPLKVDYDWFSKNENDYHDWVSHVTVLGGRPKIPFSEFDVSKKHLERAKSLPKKFYPLKKKIDLD